MLAHLFFLLNILTINVPVVYMARDYDGHWKGWALKIETFWALKWQRAKRVSFGPKKVEISGPTPFSGPSNGFSRIKLIKSKRHIKNRYRTLVSLCTWVSGPTPSNCPPSPRYMGGVGGGGGSPAARALIWLWTADPFCLSTTRSGPPPNCMG
jgi:hypothetical protein